MTKLYKPGGRVSVRKPAAVEGCQILGFGFIYWPDYCGSGRAYYAFRSPEIQGPFVASRRLALACWLVNYLEVKNR